jgi:replication factor C subunit 2/4
MDLNEPLKLEFIREIGFSHMRISEGLDTELQLLGCVARLCQLQSH